MTKYLRDKEVRNVASNATSAHSASNSTLCGTYLSKKVFIYTEKNNQSQPLWHFRIRKHSPKRSINPIKYIHEQVSFNVSNNGKIFALVEHPGGRQLVSNQIKLEDDSDGILFLAKKRLKLTTFFSSRRKRKPVHKYVPIHILSIIWITIIIINIIRNNMSYI